MSFLLIIFVGAVLPLTEAYAAAAEVFSLKGQPLVVRKGETVKVKCRLEMTLDRGDRIITDKDSFVALAIQPREDVVVKIRPESDVILDIGEDGKDVRLLDGEMITLIGDVEKGTPFRVITPSAVCGARGTGWYEGVSDDNTRVLVFEGSVEVRGVDERGFPSEESLILDEGYGTVVEKGKAPSAPKKADPGLLEEFSEEMAMLLRVRKGKMRHAISSRQSDRRMTVMESRMERAEHRMGRAAGIGGLKPVVGIGEGKAPLGPSDDDDK